MHNGEGIHICLSAYYTPKCYKQTFIKIYYRKSHYLISWVWTLPGLEYPPYILICL